MSISVLQSPGCISVLVTWGFANLHGECVFWLLFLCGKNGWKQQFYLPFESPVLLPVVRGDHSQSHNYSNKYADILCPSNPLLDIYSKHSPQIWRGHVLGRPLWVYGCCQRSGGNKVFIPVGVDVQYGSSPPLGWGMGIQHLAVMDQIYYSWPHRCILKTQCWVWKVNQNNNYSTIPCSTLKMHTHESNTHLSQTHQTGIHVVYTAPVTHVGRRMGVGDT